MHDHVRLMPWHSLPEPDDLQANFDMGRWVRALRSVPTGPVTEADFRDWLEGPLRQFFPFKRFYGVYGSLSGRHVLVRASLASGHSPEFLASRDGSFELKQRACVEWMISHRRSLLMIGTTATDAHGRIVHLQPQEIEELERFSLGAVAVHGVFDPFSRTGTYLGFSGVPADQPKHTLAVLDLIAPVVHTLYFRTREIAAADATAELTDRQQDLAVLVAQGLSDKEIAIRLGISDNTVGNHLRAIYARLGIGKRSQLIAMLK